ncbi:uncharacterized protein N7473_004699 [Penicillium subrubescens]|uniref:uncharacterized protein n=1 Tax=Penicillium subrubescens TaxID=1316194 RepID=UPI00254506EB|nr:uncharacterized protein N7473_004699 [Penicillium subrubescens]KAJ5900629.1 hypothetical protein N7473_004699 [Penicillium subrubescens]
MPSGRTRIPESHEERIDLFIKERGNLFIDMIQWHERLPSNPTPTCKSELANWLRDLRDDFYRFSVLMSPCDWSDDGLATFLLIIAVNIGRLHYERLDLYAGLSEFMVKVHELSKSLETEEHVPKLEDVWIEMTEVIFCRCEYCMKF